MPEDTIGARVRAAIGYAGFTGVPDLAAALLAAGEKGLKASTLYAIEQDRRPGTGPRDLGAIADVCGLPLEWFVADFDRLDEVSPEQPRAVIAERVLASVAARKARLEAASQSAAAEIAAQASVAGVQASQQAQAKPKPKQPARGRQRRAQGKSA